MGMMDDMQDKFGGSKDKMKERYEELRRMENDGTLDDKARDELSQLREHFEK